MAIRAASIWRLVSQPVSSALSPYSPNSTCCCPRENPALRPRCCLRNLTRLGDSISARSLRTDPDGHRRGHPGHRVRRHGLRRRAPRPPGPPPPPPRPPPPPPPPPCPPRPPPPGPPRPPPRPSPRPPPRPPRSRPSRPPRPPRSSRSGPPPAGSSSEVRSAPL